MHESKREISLGFTTDKFQEGSHICYIFRDEDERQHTMAQFIASGVETGEKVLCCVDTMSPTDFVECITELGFNMPENKKTVVVNQAKTSYCVNGHFSPQDMLKSIGEFYIQSLEEGFTGARGTGEMTWALDGDSVRLDDVMEYEAQLNMVLAKHPYTACCQYDATKFDGATIMDVLSVHPQMVIRGQVVRNPFFKEPEAFLSELHKRNKN